MMAATIVHPSVERRELHLAACRYRRQGLVCSICDEVVERAARVLGRPAAAA